MNFLDEKDTIQFDINFDQSDIISVDSYDELKIKEKIEKMQKSDIINLLKLGIHFSIIGFGNKSYGNIIVVEKDKKVIVEVKDLMKKYDIKVGGRNARYENDDLTPRRLIRFFRFQIRKFIIKYNRPSYLWRKYCVDKMNNEKFVDVCFPGAEHMVVNDDEVMFLLKIAKEITDKNEFNLLDRYYRIFESRGYGHVVGKFRNNFMYTDSDDNKKK
jgi:hypothetical protein